MNYILKQYDNDLLYFSMKNTNDGLEVLINTVNQNLQYLLPLDLELSKKGRFLEIEPMFLIFYLD